MKRIALVCLFGLSVLFPALTEAQIPNPGFETWSAGIPAGWVVDNITGFAVPVTQTSSAHSGSSALQGTVVSFNNVPFTPLVQTGFTVSQRYSTFTGWYTFSPVSGDSLYGVVLMYKSSVPIAHALFTNKTTRASYIQFSENISYLTGDVPDSCWIAFAIAGPTGNSGAYHVNSTFTLDDLAFSGTATGVSGQNTPPAIYALGQNFPNPFNPTTLISYTLSTAGPVRLTVYDILGREVATLVDGMQQRGAHEVRFDGGGLSSGVYLYRLQTTGFVEQKKMILQK